MREAGDPRLIARSWGALAVMSVRYWSTVIAKTRRELRRWRQEAQGIRDPSLRLLALSKLAEEKSNVYFAATFATLAPRGRRASAIEVIVAVQVIYDFLDGLTEQTAADPLQTGLQLFGALCDAVAPSEQPRGNYYGPHPPCLADDGYLERLVATARGGFSRLPASLTVATVAALAAGRCAQAQVRSHAAPRIGSAQLEVWATEQAAAAGVSWREYLAGAASAVISIHALIAAAADSATTPEAAARIDSFHDRSTCVLATILDGFADLHHDEASTVDQRGYLHYFPDYDQLADMLVTIIRRAVRQAPTVPHGGHQLMTLSGVVAYYLAALGPTDPARRTLAPLQRELEPLIAPPLIFMRAWRLANDRRNRRREC
jgi:hypothetical protein